MLWCLIFYIVSVAVSGAQLKADKLKLLEKVNQDPFAVIDTINAILADQHLSAQEEAEYQYVLSDAYLSAILGAKAVEAALRARQLAIEIADEEFIQWCNVQLAFSYDQSPDIELGVDYAQRAYSWAVQNNKTGLKVKALAAKGELQASLRNYTAGLEYLSQAYLLAKQFAGMEEVPPAPFVAAYIALVYEYRNEPQQAIPYLEEAMEYYRQTNNRVELSNALFGLGRAHWNLKHADKAVAYYKESKAISEELGDEQGVAYTTVDLVGVMLAKEEALSATEMDEIKRLLQRSISVFSVAENTVMQVNAMFKLAFAHRYRLEYDAALAIIDRALEAADAHQLVPINVRLLELKAFLHYRLGEYKQAHETGLLEKKAAAAYRELSDAKSFQQLRAKFELDKKDYENELLLEQNARQKAELSISKKEQTIIILAALTLGVLLLAIIILFISVKRQHKLTLKLAQTDVLTGLYNRRQTLLLLEHEKQVAMRNHHALSLAIADLDDFKNINDSYGHQFGDEVLSHVGNTIRKHFRKSDIVGRIGGEEFLFVFPDANCVNARVALQSFMADVAELPDELRRCEGLRVTFSMGLVNVADEESVTQTLARADNLMYQAKANGKARIVS